MPTRFRLNRDWCEFQSEDGFFVSDARKFLAGLTLGGWSWIGALLVKNPWLETLLAILAVALVVQLFPTALDVRQWSRATWCYVNVFIILSLVGVRFGPDLYYEWRERQERIGRKREQDKKQQQLKEQREMLERLQQGRAKRLY